MTRVRVVIAERSLFLRLDLRARVDLHDARFSAGPRPHHEGEVVSGDDDLISRAPNIFSRVDQLASEVLVVLGDIGVESIMPRDSQAGIIALAIGDSAALAADLQKRRISASDKAGRLLVSPHFYNTPEDIARFAEALSDILVTSPRQLRKA